MNMKLKVINLFMIKANYDIKFRGLIVIPLFMVRVESPPLKSLYID